MVMSKKEFRTSLLIYIPTAFVLGLIYYTDEVGFSKSLLFGMIGASGVILPFLPWFNKHKSRSNTAE